jgi:hypothetical protein
MSSKLNFHFPDTTISHLFHVSFSKDDIKILRKVVKICRII